MSISTTNPTIKDVPASFNGVDAHGASMVINQGTFTPPNIVADHFQGIAQFGGYYIMTYNNEVSYTVGYVVVANIAEEKVVKVMDTPIDGYQHPGGMQVIGNFLAMSLENAATDKSYVVFYDLSNMSDDNPPSYLPFNIPRANAGGGGVGITNCTIDGEPGYVIAVYNDGSCDFYTAPADYFTNGSQLSVPTVAFTKELEQGGYSTVSLLTDNSGATWLVGFYVDGSDDKADLYQFSVSGKTVELVDTRHFYCDGLTVSFRWGGGLHISSSGSDFSFLAIQRNPVAGGFKVDTFPQGS